MKADVVWPVGVGLPLPSRKRFVIEMHTEIQKAAVLTNIRSVTFIT